MISIRKYEEKDRKNLLKICIETSSFSTEKKEDVKFLNLMYNDYYARFEGDNCFVATDENDEAVGYILCAENFDKYYEIVKKYYYPDIKKLGKKYLTMSKGEIYIHKLFKNKYPAHLHIDILPVCQGQGTGTKLVETLISHLKEKGCHSLMLSCGMGNKGALRFYKRNGFKQIANILGSCIMVIEF